MEIIEIAFDTENELPIPTAWRNTIELIVEAFNFRAPSDKLAKIQNVSFGDRVIEISLGQIEDYPASRVLIGPRTWDRSIYIREEGYWSLLVDLHVDDELDSVSDLILPVKVTRLGNEYHYELNFIHVP